MDDSKLIQPAIRVSYKRWPGLEKNPHFAKEVLLQLEARPQFDANRSRVAFMCCCGGRSKQASQEMSDEWGINAYNVLFGMEGPLNPATGHRTELDGWKVAGNPWLQE